MRLPKNHNILFPYEHVVDTMCHELAHCVHQNHSQAFYDLMEEIKKEYKSVIAGSHGQVFGHEGEFNVYASSTATFRF